MSLETNRWEILTPDQSAFFSVQLAAANQAAFSPAAHQAAITPLNATRYRLKLSETGDEVPYEGLIWPDPYVPATCCVAIGTANSRGLGRTAFVRVTTRPDSYQMEGVALNLNQNSPSGNLYGEQHISRHDTEDQTVSYLGGCFLVMAEGAAQEYAKQQAERSEGTRQTPAISIHGVEGAVTARLFRSLSSLSSNLVIAGAMNERVAYSDETYDLAETFLKMTVKGMVRDNNTDGLILNPETRQPIGAVFETGQGLSIIRRVATYPPTIGLTTASKPQSNQDSMLVAHYYIQAKGATFDARTFPPEAYDPEFLLKTRPETNPTEQVDVSELPRLSDPGTFVLEQKILGLMSERATVPTEKDT